MNPTCTVTIAFKYALKEGEWSRNTYAIDEVHHILAYFSNDLNDWVAVEQHLPPINTPNDLLDYFRLQFPGYIFNIVETHDWVAPIATSADRFAALEFE